MRNIGQILSTHHLKGEAWGTYYINNLFKIIEKVSVIEFPLHTCQYDASKAANHYVQFSLRYQIKKLLWLLRESLIWTLLIKAMVFPVVTYGCASCTVKKAEHQRIDAFELWCWRRLLRVPWTARSNQSILKEISPGISLEGMMLKLKPWYFGHLMQRVDSLEKTLMLGGIGGRRRRGRQRMRWLDGITDSTDVSLMNSGIWWWTGRPGVLRFMGSQRVGHNWATELKRVEKLKLLKHSKKGFLNIKENLKGKI